MHSDAARTVPRQDVCLSVCHKLVFCLNGYTYPHFFRSWVLGSHTIVVFLNQMVWQYSDSDTKRVH